jgi:hypothetical protein
MPLVPTRADQVDFREHQEEWCGITAAIRDRAGRGLSYLERDGADVPVQRLGVAGEPGTTVHIGYFDRRLAATVTTEPLFDPQGTRMRQ